MAYKFQLGAATMSGSVTFKEGLSAGDNSISNVNDIAVDTISADGANIQFASAIDLNNQITTNANIDTGNIAAAVVIDKDPVITLGGDLTGNCTLSNLGDATLTATIAAGSVEHGMLADDIISGQANLGSTGVDDADEFMLSDGGTIKAITGANLYGWVFSKISGDATVASGGALTIANDAVEQAMIADDAVGADQLAANAVVNASIASNAAIDFTKLAALSDGNILVGNGSNQAASVSMTGDIAITNGGVTTIQANAVEGSMLNTNVADASTIEVSSNTLSVLKTPNALTAGNGITAAGTFDGAAARSFALQRSGSSSGLSLNADGVAVALSGSGGLGADANGVFIALPSGAGLDLAADGLKIEEGGVTNDMLAGSIANAKLANSTISGKALGASLDSLTVDDSSIQLNSGTTFNGSAARTISVKNAGITNAMLAGSIENAKLANQSVTITAGDGLKTGGSVNLGGSVTLNVDVSDFAGTGLSGDVSENLNIDAAQTGITSVLNSSLKIGYGDSDAYLSFATDNEINFAVDNAIQVVVDDGTFHPETNNDVDLGKSSNKFKDLYLAGTASIAGDLIVQGTTITLDVATVGITGSFSFEGSTANNFETTLGVVDPTADRTINLADSAGTLVPFAATPAAGTTITSTPTELNLLDAVTRGSIIYGNASGVSARLAKGAANTVLSSDGTDISYTNVTNAMLAGSITDGKLNQITTAGKVALSAIEIDGESNSVTSLADADLFIVDDGGAGSNKKMAASVIKEYVSALSITLADDTDDLEPGFNYLADLGGAEAVNLPASPNAGDVVYVKAPSNCSTTNKLTINRQGSHTIDGQTSIVLESAHAAVSIVYVAANTWKIF